MASTGEVVLVADRTPVIHQGFVVLCPLILFALSAAAMYGYKPVDWHIAKVGGAELWSGDLDLYARLPMAQMGPLSLAFAPLPRWAYMSLLLAAFGGVMWATRRPSGRGRLFHLAAGCILAPLWAYTAATGHADEVIVMCCMVALPRAVRDRDERLTAVLLIIAIAAKPTALLLLPLGFLTSRRAAIVALVGGGAAYMPFFLTDPAAMISAGRGFNSVHNGSLIDWIGYSVGDGYPAWVRPLQLVGGWVLLWLVARHRGIAVGLIAALVWRACLEPGPWGSYALPVMVAALLLPSGRRVAAIAVLGATSWLLVFNYPQADWQGAGRLLLLWLAVLVAAHRMPPVRRGGESSNNN